MRLLPLLIGRVRVDFWASAFGGEIKGTVPVGSSKGDIEVELDHVDLGKIEPLAAGHGRAHQGHRDAASSCSRAPSGKLNKASGTLDLTIADVVRQRRQDQDRRAHRAAAAPSSATSRSRPRPRTACSRSRSSRPTASDLELAGDGKVSLKDPLARRIADLFLRFKFTDAYRGKNATTKSLLGEPGSTTPGLIEMQVPKMKRAKRPDGFYGCHVFGPLKRLQFDPYDRRSRRPGPEPLPDALQASTSNRRQARRALRRPSPARPARRPPPTRRARAGGAAAAPEPAPPPAPVPRAHSPHEGPPQESPPALITMGPRAAPNPGRPWWPPQVGPLPRA